MKQNQKAFAILLSAAFLCSCASGAKIHSERGSEAASASSAPKEETSSSSSPLPKKTLEEFAASVEESGKKSLRKLTFDASPSSASRRNATITYYQREVLEEGALDVTSEEEGETTKSYVHFTGYDDSFYYEVKTDEAHASKKSVVKEASSSNQITAEDAKKNLSLVPSVTFSDLIKKISYVYSSNGKLKDSLSFDSIPSEDGGYSAEIHSWSTGSEERTYYSLTAAVGEAGDLLSFHYQQGRYAVSEIVDGKPVDGAEAEQAQSYSASMEYGNPIDDSSALSFDPSPYFVQSVKKANFGNESGIYEVGDSLFLDIPDDGFLPETALDARYFEIVSSDNEAVVGLQNNTWKALSAGTANLTIASAFGDVKATFAVTVVEPEPLIKSISAYASNKTLHVGDTQTVNVTVYLQGAADYTVLAASNDSSILSVSEPSLSKTSATMAEGTITVTGVGVGSATLTLSSKADPSKTATIAFTVEAKQATVSSDWAVGTWEASDSDDIDWTCVFSNKNHALITASDAYDTSFSFDFVEKEGSESLTISNAKGESSGLTVNMLTAKINSAKTKFTVTYSYTDSYEAYSGVLAFSK